MILAKRESAAVRGRNQTCAVHAERLVHKLDTFTDAQRAERHHIRGLIGRSTSISRLRAGIRPERAFCSFSIPKIVAYLLQLRKSG